MKLIISPLFSEYMSGRIWMGLDTVLLTEEFKNKYNVDVEIINFHHLKDSLSSLPDNTAIFYSAIYNPEYLRFIQDIVRFIRIKRPDIILIPDENQLHALENKGYQELYKEILGIKKVKGKYYGDISEVIEDKEITYPLVLKKLKGALSKGVQLINNSEELVRFKKVVKQKSLKERAAFILNRRNSFKTDKNLDPVYHLLTSNFEHFFEKRMPVVIQDFVPDLDCDYKVLVFGNKFFVVKRSVRNNDFRASGSGKLQWERPPDEVLNYAENLIKKFKVPFISLDIGMDNDRNMYLFEFQGTAFGPAALTAADKYFFRRNNIWEQINVKSNLEKEYAFAINYFINENN